MSDLIESVLAAEEALGSRDAAWDAVLATVASAHGLGHDRGRALPILAPWRRPEAIEHLGTVHESIVAERQGSGSFYTPPALVAWVLDRALPAEGEAPPSILDPACGAGHFLLAAARRLISRGLSPDQAVALVHGVDLDPVAVAITRLRLRVLAPRVEPEVRVGDGLGPHPGAPYDVVLGNPPFLGRLRNRTTTAVAPDPLRAPRVAGLAAYTDASAVFLRHSLDLVHAGGTVALVQPLSLLSARDAAPVRSAVAAAGAVTAFWSSLTPLFSGTSVLTCVPVLCAGASQGPVATWHGPAFVAGEDQVLPPAEWGPLTARAAGIPVVAPRTSGTLGDLGLCTADFRDQYYGLVPFVHEMDDTAGGAGSATAPLITSGLIDPAECRWGRAPTRFAKTRYAAPLVDLDALHAEGSLSRWARERLMPKVLIATQGRVIEAAVDERGAWLPSVPVLTLVTEPDRLWHALAVLLSPPVAAGAAARYLGAALAPDAIKLSAKQVAGLPLPHDADRWDEGAALARAAQQAGPGQRHAALRALAQVMCAAYADDSALEWWLERLPQRG
ncbi:MAG: N-6 DNA methylase [Nocardioides sp.]